MEGIKYGGIPSKEELETCPGIPTKKRATISRVAAIECVQHIACNPCVNACPFGAIQMGESITDLPVLKADKCVGCGKCVAICPGLAITLIDASGDEEGTIDFPYEYYPFPQEGAIVDAVDRAGNVICKGKIVRVHQPDPSDGTRVVRMSVPKEYIWEVKSMKRLTSVEVQNG